MYADYTQNPLFRPLVRALTRTQRQNLIALVLAVQCARTLIQWQLALFLACAITTASCYRRLERVLSWDERVWGGLSRAWVRAVIACFAPGSGPLVLLIDWTLHRDRCRSLWIALPVGGRAVPVAFWLAPPTMGGKGAQRQFEDEALTQLREWLPQSRRVVLIGDRGFRGQDRMKFLKRLRFHFVLRITGDTNIETKSGWVALREVAPGLGEGRRWTKVRYGKTAPGGPIRVNIVAVRQALLEPKRLKTNKGKASAKIAEETTWFLATDLPPEIDVVALYRMRMQIEQTFRDEKAVLGLEQERTKEPWVRLRGLMWAMTIGLAWDLQQGSGNAQAPARLPRVEGEGTLVPPLSEPQYRSESATREGLHEQFVDLVLGRSEFQAELNVMAQKSERMKARPQVAGRRRSTPALRNRRKRQSVLHVRA